ncbi:MAG: hypothetical protein ACXWW4_16625, partial [Candidatus Binatia bacterium]
GGWRLRWDLFCTNAGDGQFTDSQQQPREFRLFLPDHLVTNQGAYGESKSVIDLRTLTEFQQSFASYVSENRAQSAKPSAPL